MSVTSRLPHLQTTLNSSTSIFLWGTSSATRSGNFPHHFQDGMNSCTFAMSPTQAAGKNLSMLLIDYIEISAPFYEQWPPKTHTDIFIESDNKSDEENYGREVLTRFLRRVWRRPVTSKEVDQFMALFAKYRPGFSNFEDAMLEVLATALATPEFLYLTQRVDCQTLLKHPARSVTWNWPAASPFFCGRVFLTTNCCNSQSKES